MANAKRKDNRGRVLKEGEYQRPNGSYEFKWRDHRGNRHSVYAETLEKLREKELDVLRDALNGKPVENKKITINDLYNRWRELKKGLKDNTLQNYIYLYEMFVEPDFGKTRIADLRRTDVRAFYNSLHDNRQLEVSTIDSIHTVLHQVLELGVEDEYIGYNPSDNALKELKRAFNHEKKKRKALTVKEQELLENYLIKQGKHHRWFPVITTMLWTGMRVGEITGLRWCDIDLENDIITIDHTLVYYSKGKNKGCKYAINTPKSEAGKRIIPMLPRVKKAFYEEKEYQEQLGMKCRDTIDGYTNFIFLNRFGGVQQQGTLNDAIKRIITKCNLEQLDENNDENVTLLPDFSCHTLRHTFATRMCEKNVNIKAIQDILGHKDIQTTMDIYADATKDFKIEQMITFDKYFQDEYAEQTD